MADAKRSGEEFGLGTAHPEAHAPRFFRDSTVERPAEGRPEAGPRAASPHPDPQADLNFCGPVCGYIILIAANGKLRI